MTNKSEQAGEESEIWQGGYSLPALYAMLTWLAIFLVIIAIAIACVPSLRGSMMTWTLVMGGGLAGAVALFGVYLYKRLDRWFEFSNEKIRHREGILVRSHYVMELIRVDDVSYEQGPIEAFFGCGTIYISSSDPTHPDLELLGIEKVRDVADLIDHARRNERKLRGFHVESI